jgi:hypothetical protein
MGKLSRDDMIARRTENAKTRYTSDYVKNIIQKPPVVNDNINIDNHNLNPKLQNIQFHPIDNKKRTEKLAEMVEKRKINRIPRIQVLNTNNTISDTIIYEANRFINLLKELDMYETNLETAPEYQIPYIKEKINNIRNELKINK